MISPVPFPSAPRVWQAAGRPGAPFLSVLHLSHLSGGGGGRGELCDCIALDAAGCFRSALSARAPVMDAARRSKRQCKFDRTVLRRTNPLRSARRAH